MLSAFGAGRENRTPDLMLTRQLLYLLSYTGMFGSATWARTRDRWINSPLLYQLSYRGINCCLSFYPGRGTPEFGTSGRTRTGTAFLPRDFKSLVSTNFTTRACNLLFIAQSTPTLIVSVL